MNITEKLSPYISLIEQEMHKLTTYRHVPAFYDPIFYILELSGKKIRPLLVLLSCGIAGGKVEDAIFAATAVELLHDFTLVHDDIMDNDETRRGKPTIHVKWDLNTAILCGDGLLGFAFQKLLQSPVNNRAELAEKFTEAMIIICEGQALDKMFENDDSVAEQQYLDMIEHKTAALIRLSCSLGGMIAGAPETTIKNLYTIGHNLGMVFQIQDDILDVMADPLKLGKKVGSDFVMHKQTILSIKLRRKIGEQKFKKLDWSSYKAALDKEGILDVMNSVCDAYYNKALNLLNTFADSEYKELMLSLCEQIKGRRF